MEDPRQSVLNKVHSKKGFNVTRDYRPHMKDALLETIFYTIADYIHQEREANETGVGDLEKTYSFPQEFIDCDDPHEWLEKHRDKDDTALIMHIFDNIFLMKAGKHRRILLYTVNILHFGL